MEGKPLAALVSAVGLAVIAICVGILYGGGPPPAAARPKPPPPSDQYDPDIKYSGMVYRAMVEQDAKTYGVPAPTSEQIRAPNPYFEEVLGRRRIKAKQSVETPHLKITLLIQKENAATEGQAFGYEHLVLRIENLSAKYLAYRVETEVSDKKRCANKGTIPHNAIVIEPNQTIERTECLYREDAVDVTHVEVIEMSPLEALYVSRLPPQLVLYDSRASAGHVVPKGTACRQTFSWRDIRDGAERKQLGWRDVIDFYARHNCDEFSFFKSYRYRTDANAPLPARG